ncbi:DUF3291 domain-containing protein [Streptomyces sp. NPDC051561]|uniref:DUF3291 domain-containing protein n=1 Tax=Streptomyces sp. NPDC051561 TaxID=3365658 RepID=UPI0037BDD116
MISTSAYALAQVNIARLKYPLTSPELKDFVDGLDPVNAVADASDGFIWRLQTDDGDATELRVFGDEWLIINMSVWRNVDALKAFMYAGRHRELLKRRYEWFERMQEAMAALWWVPAGHRPTVGEAEERLTTLRELGPTDAVFTLNSLFPAPGTTTPAPPAAPATPPASR